MGRIADRIASEVIQRHSRATAQACCLTFSCTSVCDHVRPPCRHQNSLCRKWITSFACTALSALRIRAEACLHGLCQASHNRSHVTADWRAGQLQLSTCTFVACHLQCSQRSLVSLYAEDLVQSLVATMTVSDTARPTGLRIRQALTARGCPTVHSFSADVKSRRGLAIGEQTERSLRKIVLGPSESCSTWPFMPSISYLTGLRPLVWRISSPGVAIH